MAYHIVNLIADPGPTVIIDGMTGINGIRFVGTFPQQTSITLQWQIGDGGVPLSASGIYFPDPLPLNTSGRLVVKGILYNARGSDSRDFISGNIYDNIIYGDGKRTGNGGNDVLFGDEGDDTIYGGAGKDDIGGGEGNDILYGDEGNDELSGGAGRDIVEGGVGADTLSGGAGPGDTVSYASSDAGVRVKITSGETTIGKGGHAQNDKINGFTDVIGSKFDDVITDTVKGTVAFGGNKNVFEGRGGADRLELGGGRDKGYGGGGNDTILGEAGDDRLDGDSGADTLNGGSGKDVLTGGIGADLLEGGGGADVFRFLTIADSTHSPAGRDVIADFSRKQGDKIDLKTIDAKTDKAGNEAFSFIVSDDFSGKAGELRYEIRNGKTYVQGDVDGDAIRDFAIKLDGQFDLKAEDFLL